MTDTFADDGWDELTRELGVEKVPATDDPTEDDAELVSENEFEPAAEGDEFDSGLDSESDAPDGTDATGEEQPETGKKRRRRRRRRKKGPGEGEAGEAAAGDEAASEPAGEEPVYVENDYETGPSSDRDELTPVGVGAEEDTAGEALRDLIVNWNVPAWDAIIGGLYRPER